MPNVEYCFISVSAQGADVGVSTVHCLCDVVVLG